jgi:hypothetical protein
MSGPKVSVYETIKRRNIRVQLECLQQSISYCGQIKKAIGSLLGLNGQIQKFLSAFDLVSRHSEDYSGEIAVLKDLQNILPQDCQSFIDSLSSYTPLLQTDKITPTDAELAAREKTLAELRSLRNRVTARQKEVEKILSSIEAKAAQGELEVENLIYDSLNIRKDERAEQGVTEENLNVEDIVNNRFDLSGISPAETEEERFATGKKSLDAELRALSLSQTDLKGEVISAASALSKVTTREQLATFKALTVKPLLKKIEAARLRAQEEKDELEELQLRYNSLCSIAGVQPEMFSMTADAAAKMKDRIAALEKQVVMQTEQEYISDCVQEVMSEMGYDIIGNRSVTKRSGKRFRNELFSYGEGTAINVTYDANGQIAMELGGIGMTDRIPTSRENDLLCKDMQAFCSDFKDFEERLKAKGVIMKSRVSMAPPAAEYASIINVSDYNVTAPVKEMSVRKPRYEAAPKRMLRKDNS